MQRAELTRYLDELLESARFRDYCPNGLQVEGKDDIVRVVAGVTASRALIAAAIERGADAMLVHHGWFWRGEDVRVTGMRRARLADVLAHGINLIAYHLPLDAHLEYGNNAQLGRLMGWHADGRCGEQELVFNGTTSGAPSAEALSVELSAKLGRDTTLVGDSGRTVRRIAWCTGAAQGYFEAAIAAGADCYVSGEISEQTVHMARECGVPYIAAGHHATERLGVGALARHIQERFGLDCCFVDIDNPI